MLYLILQWYILVPALLALLYWHGTKNFSHWRKHGVKHIPPVFFFGNIRKRVLFQQSFHEIQKELYFAFPGEKIAGIYEGRRPTLMVRDPELIRLIMVRDFDHFVDRPFLRFPQRPSIANMLISLQGAHWKSVRATLTPTFTSGKIKAMSLLVTDVGKQMVSYLEKTIDKPDGCDMEMKDFFGRFTMDVIASCAFGVQCDSLTTPDAEFAAFAGKFNDVPIYERLMIFSILLFAPNLARFFPLSFLNRDVAKFLESVVRDTKAQRIKNGIRRNDFLQLMIDTADADKADGKKTVLTEDIVIAQSILFLLAGFETSSTVLAFTAYELALNPDIQSKLREEIFKVLEKHQRKCTYEAVQEMEYLDMVIHESMRKHPPVARMDRQCTAAYTVPDTNLKLEPGTSVTIPVMGLHYDPEYYPDPDKFDPLRFSSEEKARRSPYVYLPFGAGPRNCIGARFALTSTKMAMAYLLQDFKVEPCGKTEVPYKYSKFSMLLKADKGVWLNLKRLVEVASPS